jgi:hypothetical protein
MLSRIDLPFRKALWFLLLIMLRIGSILGNDFSNNLITYIEEVCIDLAS